MFKKVLAVLVLILASFMLSGAVALTAHIILRHDFTAWIVLGILLLLVVGVLLIWSIVGLAPWWPTALGIILILNSARGLITTDDLRLLITAVVGGIVGIGLIVYHQIRRRQVRENV